MMKNIFDNFLNDEENKKRIIIALIIMGFALIVTFGGRFFKKDNESDIEQKFKAYASTYYQKGFYDTFVDVELNGNKEALSKYSTEGIKIYADEVFRGSELDPVQYFKDEDGTCSLNTSVARIYPQAPYGSSDFKIEVSVDC